MIIRMSLTSLLLFGLMIFQDICKSAESNSAADALIADYANNTNLGPTLIDSASDCTWNRKYEDAERLYKAVNDKQPNTDWGIKSRLGLSRVGTLKLIEQKDYEEAYQRTNSMINEFKDEPETTIALFHIGQEFFWQRQFGEAREAFDRGVEMFPDSPAANEMRLWSAKTGCCVLIYGRRATDKEVVAAIDKMINDFQDDPGLPFAVYWVTKEYEWAKGTLLSRASWYDKPNSVYQQIMQKFSNTPFGQAAESDQKRLKHRMKIFDLIKKSDQKAIDNAIEKMTADLRGRSEVAGELYWIACGFEEHPDKEKLSKKIYERIVKDYPQSEEANSATLDIRRRAITDLINAGDAKEAEDLMDKFVVDFKGHPYAASCLWRVAIGYYKKAREANLEGDAEGAKISFRKATEIWEHILSSFPDSEIAPNVCYSLAVVNAQELQEYQKGIDYFKMVVNKWPKYEYAGQAQTFTVEYSNKLKSNINAK